MNTIWIVMPILIVLMFLLGIDLSKKAFADIARKSNASAGYFYTKSQ